MPGLYKDEGIVLHAIKLGEADRIVTLFTRGNGKVRAVAKGIRKTKSRFGARLEPFSHVQLLIYRGRNLDTITSVDILTSFDAVRTELHLYAAAAAMAEIVDKITPERERAAPTYSLLLAGLRALADGRAGGTVPAFMIKLLSISGYHPQLRACAGCGSDFPLSAFSPAMGGVLCDRCRDEDPGARRLGSDSLLLMRRLLAADFGAGTESRTEAEVTDILRTYSEYHLERPLRSLKLLSSI
jgi:DNA repair protein RecO (recombination protein O)